MKKLYLCRVKFRIIMKKFWLVCSLLLILTGCSSQKKIVILDREINEVTLKKGQSFEIEFLTNASTGYWWQLTNEAEVTVVAPQDKRYESNAPVGMVGASSHLFWKFEAKEKGTQTLKFVYAREDWGQAIRIRNVVVTVK